MALRIGRYLLGDRLAAGGMGEVFLATQTGIGGFQKPLALKLLLPHLATDARAVKMFLDEAQLAARMTHPNVVQILDVGTEGGRYFIAMELVRGVSLGKLISALKQRKLDTKEAHVVLVARQLCEGLQHAHELKGPRGESLGLVHRDISPSNVLISVDGTVKLTDFGVALARGMLTQSVPDALMGKAAYMSPEQAARLPLDRRADVFSLGMTLYHFATLANPFRRESDSETFKALATEALPPLEDVSPQLAHAVAAATKKDAGERVSTARALRDLLPPVADDATDTLAALVRELCADEIGELDQKTQHAATQQDETPAVSAPVPRSAPRRWIAVAALGLGAVGIAGGLALGKKQPPPEPVTVAVPEPTPNPTPTPTPEPPAPEPERPTPIHHATKKPVGYLSVDSQPWAQVFINGKLKGETPLSSLVLEAGTINVELKNPEIHASVHRVVKLEPDQRQTLKVKLK